MTNYDNKFFKSRKAEVIFYALHTDGRVRSKGLGITEKQYFSTEAADEWKDGLMKDLGNRKTPDVADAKRKIMSMYNMMTEPDTDTDE